MHVITVKPEEVFQALTEPTRIRTACLLAMTSEESCLCELVDSLLEAQYKLSKHLKILKRAVLLTAENEGRFVYHRLVTEPRSHLRSLYNLVRALPGASKVYQNDLRRFRERLCLREDGSCGVGIQSRELAMGID